MNTLSMFMIPVARKFNLLRFFGNFFIRLRKELKELRNVHVYSKDEFLSNMHRCIVVLTKVGLLFISLTMLIPAVFIGTISNLCWFGQWIFVVVALDYFGACLETYDEEPEGDE